MARPKKSIPRTFRGPGRATKRETLVDSDLATNETETRGGRDEDTYGEVTARDAFEVAPQPK